MFPKRDDCPIRRVQPHPHRLFFNLRNLGLFTDRNGRRPRRRPQKGSPSPKNAGLGASHQFLHRERRCGTLSRETKESEGLANTFLSAVIDLARGLSWDLSPQPPESELKSSDVACATSRRGYLRLGSGFLFPPVAVVPINFADSKRPRPSFS